MTERCDLHLCAMEVSMATVRAASTIKWHHGISGDTYQPKYLSKYITNFHPYKKLKYARTVLDFMHKQCDVVNQCM